jgi:RNA polymerase sigma factor (sigma-70 family)
MPHDDAYWEGLISGLRAGDEGAATDFYAHFGPLLEGLASQHLASGMRRRVGPDDVAHSACRTFLRRIQGGHFELQARDNLWNLLCAITLAKARKKARFHLADKRGLGREVHPEASDEGTSDRFEPASRSPTPEQAAAFADQFHHLLQSLDDEERQIVLLRLEDRTQVEIAAAIGTSERTVRRLMKQLEERLAGALGEH